MRPPVDVLMLGGGRAEELEAEIARARQFHRQAMTRVEALAEENERLRKDVAFAYSRGFKRGAEDMRERCAREVEAHNLTWLAKVLRDMQLLEVP